MEYKEKFINYWEFLEIPMNSSIGDIKKAFAIKFERIENSINREENTYCLEDLKICISAYETLRSPYLRLIHNCQIDGEEPPTTSDWEEYFSEDGISDDLSEDENRNFLLWLLSKANKLNSKKKSYSELANKLYNLFIKEKEKQEEKELHQKNKKNSLK